VASHRLTNADELGKLHKRVQQVSSQGFQQLAATPGILRREDRVKHANARIGRPAEYSPIVHKEGFLPPAPPLNGPGPSPADPEPEAYLVRAQCDPKWAVQAPHERDAVITNMKAQRATHVAKMKQQHHAELAKVEAKRDAQVAKVQAESDSQVAQMTQTIAEMQKEIELLKKQGSSAPMPLTPASPSPLAEPQSPLFPATTPQAVTDEEASGGALSVRREKGHDAALPPDSSARGKEAGGDGLLPVERNAQSTDPEPEFTTMRPSTGRKRKTEDDHPVASNGKEDTNVGHGNKRSKVTDLFARLKVTETEDDVQAAAGADAGGSKMDGPAPSPSTMPGMMTTGSRRKGEAPMHGSSANSSNAHGRQESAAGRSPAAIVQPAPKRDKFLKF
jgi:hypothetical protein